MLTIKCCLVSAEMFVSPVLHEEEGRGFRYEDIGDEVTGGKRRSEGESLVVCERVDAPADELTKVIVENDLTELPIAMSSALSPIMRHPAEILIAATLWREGRNREPEDSLARYDRLQSSITLSGIPLDSA